MNQKLYFLFLLGIFCSLSVAADSFTYDGTYAYQGTTFYYNILNGNSLEITYTGLDEDYYPTSNYSGTVVIPASIKISSKTYPVTTIGESAFEKSRVSKVTIPSSVSTINSSAFRTCKSLTEVVFDGTSSLVTIGNSAFAECNSLTAINIPNSVTSIGEDAFAGCI